MVSGRPGNRPGYGREARGPGHPDESEDGSGGSRRSRGCDGVPPGPGARRPRGRQHGLPHAVEGDRVEGPRGGAPGPRPGLHGRRKPVRPGPLSRGRRAAPTVVVRRDRRRARPGRRARRHEVRAPPDRLCEAGFGSRPQRLPRARFDRGKKLPAPSSHVLGVRPPSGCARESYLSVARRPQAPDARRRQLQASCSCHSIVYTPQLTKMRRRYKSLHSSHVTVATL